MQTAETFALEGLQLQLKLTNSNEQTVQVQAVTAAVEPRPSRQMRPPRRPPGSGQAKSVEYADGLQGVSVCAKASSFVGKFEDPASAGCARL